MGEEGVADHVAQFLLLSPLPSGLNDPVVGDACGSDGNGDEEWKRVDFVILMSASKKKKKYFMLSPGLRVTELSKQAFAMRSGYYYHRKQFRPVLSENNSI